MLENTKQLKLLPLSYLIEANEEDAGDLPPAKLARETEAAARSSSVLTRREKGGGRVHCRAGLLSRTLPCGAGSKYTRGK